MSGKRNKTEWWLEDEAADDKEDKKPDFLKDKDKKEEGLIREEWGVNSGTAESHSDKEPPAMAVPADGSPESFPVKTVPGVGGVHSSTKQSSKESYKLVDIPRYTSVFLKETEETEEEDDKKEDKAEEDKKKEEALRAKNRYKPLYPEKKTVKEDIVLGQSAENSLERAIMVANKALRLAQPNTPASIANKMLYFIDAVLGDVFADDPNGDANRSRVVRAIKLNIS